MKRREFITLLGGAAAAWPLAARAQQQPKVLRIGIASANPRSFSTWVAFERRLRELGYVDGRNLTFEFIHLSKNLDQSKVAMRELINRKVDMIVDAGEIATLQAAMSQTRTMPIIMLAVAYDPLAAGYIESLARPGGNVTGVFLRRPELIEKQLEVLAEAFPGRRRLALLWDGSNEASFRTVEETAQKVRFDLQSLRLENPPYDFIAAFAKLAEDKPEVVFVLSSVFFNEHAQEIAQLAIRHALPTMFTSRRYVQARGAIVLRSGHTRHVSAGRRLCRSGRERVEAGGLASRAADQIRAGAQSEDRKDNRCDRPDGNSVTGYGGDRVRRRAFISLLGGAAAWPLAARAQRPAMPVVGFVHSVVANPGPSVGGYSTEGSGRSLHAILIGSSVDMAPGLRELIALSLLASLGCALHWPTVTCFSSLFLAAPSQWRLSRRYDVYGEVIERLVRLLAD